MNKKIIIITLILCVVLISVVSGYICIYKEDNNNVVKFKQKLNKLSFEQDLKNNMTIEAIELKLKYFIRCRK